jgi:hypothetical protein
MNKLFPHFKRVLMSSLLFVFLSGIGSLGHSAISCTALYKIVLKRPLRAHGFSFEILFLLKTLKPW